MDQIIKHGVQLAVGMDPGSEKDMRATLRKIFSEAGNSINFDTPENKKAIMELASVFRDMFESVGNKKIDFAKIMGLSSGKDMFEALKGSANEMANVWANIVKRMGTNSLSSIFMKDQSAIDEALTRLSKSKREANKFIKEARSAFADEGSADIKYLLKEADKSKTEFGTATSWEKREVAALRYLNVYRRMMQITQDGTNVDKLTDSEATIFKNLGKIGPYVTRQLEEAKAYLQSSVQNIFNLADGKSLIGLTSGGAVDFDVAPRLIKTLDVGDVLGGKKNIVVPITSEIDSSFKENLNELRRLYQENTQEAYDAFESLQEKMVSGLKGRFKNTAIARLLNFAEMDDAEVTDDSYQDIYGRFVKYGLPVGTGTGTGDGSGSGSTLDDVANAERIAEANRMAAEQAEREKAAKDYISSHKSPLGEKYDAASEDVRALVDDLVRLDQQLQTLDDRTAATQMDGFDKWNPTDEHKTTIVNTLNEYQRVMNQISDFSIETEDDKKRLIELKEEAFQLANTLQMAYRSDSNPDSYIKEYGISREQAIEFMDINNISSQLKNEILTTLKDSMHSVFGQITKLDGQFARMLLDNVDDWGELNNKTVQSLSIDDQLKETIALLEKEELTYEDILTLVREYNNESKMKELAKAGNWDEYDKIFAHHADIARKLVPVNMMGIGSDSPDKWLATVGMSAETAAQRLKELYDRLHQVVSIDDELEIGLDEDDDIRRENGALEDRLELLRDIAEQYGINISQKQRNSYERLNQKDMDVGLTPKEYERYYELGDQIDQTDQALEEFGNTYDRIIVKLENGKKIEILPDDKGLRTLAKINEEYGESYNGIQIEDVVYERVQQEILAHQQNVEAIQTEVQAQKELNKIKDDADNEGLIDAQPDDNIFSQIDQTDGVTTDEVQNLEAVRAKVAEITAAVEAKTTAFQNEKTAVSAVVDEEVKKLDELEEKVKSITSTIQGLLNNIKNGESNLGEALNNVVVNVNYPKSEGEDKFNTDGLKTMLSDITYKVKLSKSETDKHANKIELDESVLTNTLKTVFADILHKPEAPAEATQEPWARESTLGSVKDILTQIQTNTTPIVESKATAQPKSMLPETRLSEIKELLSQINGKISGKISGVVKSESTDKPSVSTTKKKHKEGTISHGKADGEFASPQKMLDYYYWLEEQVTQYKDNAMYVEELNKVIKQLTPRVIDFYRDLAESGKEDPAWLAPLNEKHNLHMSKIRGGQSLAEDKKEAKDTQKAVEDLLKAYERLGKLRAERDMLPQGVKRDELQKEIKREGDRLRHRSARLGVDSTRTQEAADVGAHSVQYDQLIDRVERLGKLEEKLVSLKKGTGSYKDTENEITNLNREIALIEKKVKLTQEEKIKLDKIRRANADAVNQKTNQQADASASAEQQKKVQRLTALYRELGTAEAKLNNTKEGTDAYKAIDKNISGLWQQIKLEGDLDDVLQKRLETERRLVKEKKERSIAEINGRKSLREEIADNKKSASANKVASYSRAGRDVLFAASGLDFDATENNAEVQKLTKALEHLDSVEKRLASNDWVMDKGDKEELAKATGEVNKYTEAVTLLVNSAKMFGDDNSISLNRNIGAGDIKTQLVDAAKEAHGAKFRFEEFDDELQTITGTLKVGPREFRKVTIGVNQFSGAIRESQGVLKKTETFIQSFKRKLSEISSYFSASSVIFKAVSMVRQGIQYVREIDLALTELKKVTDETEETYRKFLNTASKTAEKVGSTIKDVVSSTADWARLGYSMEEAAKFAETTQILMNVSEFTDVSQATDTLISAIQAFGYTAETSMDVVDLLNTIGKYNCRGYIVIYNQADNYNG